MKTQKMNLANIMGKLSRAEMKKIMAGSGETCNCNSKDDCSTSKPYCVNGCGGPVGGKWGNCAASAAG